jgi:hypothetical protein
MIVELRANPHDLLGIATEDLLKQWSNLVEQWAAGSVGSSVDATFRWSKDIDSELAEFLLHGLERILHSPGVRSRITTEEMIRHRPFTMHVVQAFVDGLSAEGQTHVHYVDQIRTMFGAALD